MERVGKKHRVKKLVYLLNLGDWIPIRDVRKLIWNKLNQFDKTIVWCAHVKKRQIELLRQRAKLIAACIFYGYIDLLEWSFGDWCFLDFLDIIIKSVGASGCLKSLEWIINKKPSTCERISEYAAACGRIEILEWLEKHGFRLSSQIGYDASGTGQLEIIKWAYKREYTLDVRLILDHAERTKKTHVVQWLREELNIPI